MSAGDMAFQKPIISVIVPAYNVEDYIEKCIQSIENQAEKNIEIIIVDDGSTDSTGVLADKLAETDGRIRLIHQYNSGVSKARNTGLDAAKGHYITFVDADDFLAQDYLTYMLHLIRKDDSDFALSVNCFTKQGEEQVEQSRYMLLKPEETVALLLSPRVIVGCWNKVYKRRFLNDHMLRFNTDLFYGEGLYFITMAAQAANHVAVGNHKAYYYRRNNQTSVTTKFKIESVYNGEKSIEQIERDLKIDSKGIQHMLLLHRSMYYIGAIVKLEENKKTGEYRTEYDRWLSFIRKHIGEIISYKDVPMYRKLLLTGGCISPKLMTRLNVWRKERIARNSVT